MYKIVLYCGADINVYFSSLEKLNDLIIISRYRLMAKAGNDNNAMR